MREYELNVIVQPEISEEGSQAIFARVDDALEKVGGIRLMNEDLGKRKLAYEIQKFQKGHYYLYSFLDDGQVVPELERLMRIEESVLRFLTVKVADQVADIEARKSSAAEAEQDQAKRLAEKAAREAEEAVARAAAEEAARVSAAEEAARVAAAAETKAAEEAEAAAEGDGDSESSADGESAEKAGDSAEEKSE